MSLQCTQTASNWYTSQGKLHRTNATLNESLCCQQHHTYHMLSQQINPGKSLIYNFWQNIKWWIHAEAIRAEQQTPGPTGTYIWCQILGPISANATHPTPPPPTTTPPYYNKNIYIWLYKNLEYLSFDFNKLEYFSMLFFFPTSALWIWNWGRIRDMWTY